MDVLIDKRELSAKARERNLSLNIIEKDYVLGWLLFGLSAIDSLVFKGGTALSKIYFPEIWRLSEDLDFSLLNGDFSVVTEKIPEILKSLEKKSKIKFILGNQFSNPGYLQLKIKYEAVIGRNWIKVDVTKNDLVEKPSLKNIGMSFSDYPTFKIKVESVEEIFCAKLRTLIERKKSRDYFDLWKLTKLSLDFNKVRKILPKKLEIKSIQLNSLDQIFPEDLSDVLIPYWERELGRLVHPLPDLKLVQKELKEFINGKFFHHP
ncbi:MAG: nucleotidyl transferase AbiEii/AbiGii toxin family protein [Acidobacteria bacterium]|nr:nucleotidyl transferase AbiEii/AbiGii toxin family protein [Acidobacteriota bacterium]